MLNQAKQSGFTLVEVLVSVVVIAIGLLGIASLQASAIKSTSTANMRSVAAINVQTLVAKMRANNSFWRYEIADDESNTIVVSSSTSGSGSEYEARGASLTGHTLATCAAVTGTDPVPCSVIDQARYDLESWMEHVSAVLVNPKADISINSNGPGDRILIDLSWDEKTMGSTTNLSEVRRMHYQVGLRI